MINLLQLFGGRLKKSLVRTSLLSALVVAGSTFAFGGTTGITLGSNDFGNCYPFLCFAGDGGTAYQEQFNASYFSGPITITQFTLFLAGSSDSAQMDPAHFDISFSTSAVDYGSMTGTFSDNVGADNTAFGSYDLQGTMPTFLTMTAAGPGFTYDPTSGAPLLMNIVVTSTGDRACPYCTFFQADYTGQQVLRSFYENGYGQVLNVLGAPVINFNGSYDGGTVLGSGETLGGSGAPEPGTWAMLISGVAAVAFRVRSRKA